jgi:hypothetical protein
MTASRLSRQTKKNLRIMARVSIVVALLCVLAMARYVDCEIRQIKQSAHDAESRAAASIAESSKATERCLRRLEELGASDRGN